MHNIYEPGEMIAGADEVAAERRSDEQRIEDSGKSKAMAFLLMGGEVLEGGKGKGN